MAAVAEAVRTEERYIDREFSWLAFNTRVLELAEDPDVPLLERKRILDSAFEERTLVRRTPFVRPPVRRWMVAWRGLGFREVAFKAANSRYTPGRSNEGWAAVPIPRR